MSYQLMTWAARQRTGSITRKAVLMSLANHANGHTGRCHPSVARIAEEIEGGERAVRDALSALVDLGLVTRERRRRADGSLGTYEYGFPLAAGGAEPAAADAGRPAAADAALNQEVLNQEGTTANAVVQGYVGERTVTIGGLSSDGGQLATTYKAPAKVDRKRVTIEEAQVAAIVLHFWNAETGQRLRAKEWLGKIIMRVREYPEATANDHAFVIRCALAKPWWRGDPSPSVVYGNGAQFERALTEARKTHEGGGDDQRLAAIVEAAQRRRAS